MLHEKHKLVVYLFTKKLVFTVDFASTFVLAVALFIVEVDSFVVPSADENIKRDDNESDSAINKDV